MSMRAAEKLFVYWVPATLLHLVLAWALWHTPNALYGMYANDDGMWAAWNVEGILQWGRFLDLSPFNPLSGMGSMFLPNLPWLNPAAASLALPLARDLTYLISYTIYYVEIFVSIAVLARTLGLSPIRSSCVAQFYLLILFPPISVVFDMFSWYSLAPVNAHLLAVANLALACFVSLGKGTDVRNIALAAVAVALIFIGLFSAPITFLTYAPVYATAALAFVVWERWTARASAGVSALR